jgi:FKBP-type peptidyl-prolyl cis-trans isomerase (trigger factor)
LGTLVMETKVIKYKVVLQSALKRAVEIIVPGHLTESYIPRAIEGIGHDAEIPGFRKGRATSVAVQAHYGEKRVREIAADLLARDAFSQVSEILPDKPATPPDFLLPELTPGTDYTFEAAYYIHPPDPNQVTRELAGMSYIEPASALWT